MYLVFCICVIMSLFFPTESVKSSWSQDGANEKRTGSTEEQPDTPWTFVWSFNGPDSQGGIGNHLYDAPKEARIVAGGGILLVPAGKEGVYALSETQGTVLWHFQGDTFDASGAIDDVGRYAYIGSAGGTLYKLRLSDGSVVGSVSVSSGISKAVLLSGGYVYAVTNAGSLVSVAAVNMQVVWTYQANAKAVTPPAISEKNSLIVFATEDLNVHGVNSHDGVLNWRSKPTPNAPVFPYEFTNGWPVIADEHGIVLLRMRLEHRFMEDYPSDKGIYPNDQEVTRTYIKEHRNHQNLFAMRLSDGSEAFIPAVGYGSTEGIDTVHSTTGGSYGEMGSMPVVKKWSDGSEVVYLHFRNGQSNPADYRWDGHMGEMVLDDTTIPGLHAGDFRFVRMSNLNGYGGNAYVHIVDEQTPLTLAGSILCNAHWAASSCVKITDRSSIRGITYQQPIETQKLPVVVRAIKPCGEKNLVTHMVSCGLQYFTDGGRYFDGPGFWAYWGVADPPGWRIGSGNTASNTYSSGFLPRITIISDGYVFVEGNGGDIMAFRHSGAAVPTATTAPLTGTGVPNVPGDLTHDGKVTYSDLQMIINTIGANILYSYAEVVKHYGL